MNIALIFAGGTGQRVNKGSKPKQFLELHGKPILLYTLEHFEVHPLIDKIIIVCLESWINELKKLLRRYDINKVFKIVPGGSTGHESIYNGLKSIESSSKHDDIVLIHDGVRPLIEEELITSNINKVKEFGTCITVEAATESVVHLDKDGMIVSVPNRNEMYVAKAPQSFLYGLIWKYYQKASDDGILAIDSSHLLSLYGVEMHTIKSTPNNMKITSPVDYYIFRALYEAQENKQILGI